MKKKIVFSVLFILFLCGRFFVPDIHSRNYSPEEQLMLVGIGALRDGFYDVAEKQFSHFIKDYPHHVKVYDIYFLLGRTLLHKGKLKEAKTAFARIANDKKDFECMDFTLFWLAEIERQLGSNEESRKLLISLIQRYPRFEWSDYSYYLLGLLDLTSNQFALAETSFKKVSLLSRNSDLIRSSSFWLGVVSFRQNDFEAATHYFRTVWEDSKSTPQTFSKYALLWLGETHLRWGKFDEARLNYQAFFDKFKHDSLSSGIQWRLAYCEYRLGNLKESIEIFQTLKDKLTDPILILHTHYVLGQIFLATGDYPSSIKEINSLLSKSPGNRLSAASLLTLFWNLVHLQEMPEASKTFQTLQKTDHVEDERTFIQWLNAELIFAEGRVSDSLPYYFNIVNTRFREKALYQIGKGYFFENKFREAITNFDILSLEFPSSNYADESLFMKAECFKQSGSLDHALETYATIVRQNKHNLWHLFALIQIGDIAFVRNENKKAENAFKEVIEGFPDHPLSYHAAFQLGNLYFKRNNIAEAVQYYSAVLRGNLLELLGKAYFSLGEIFYLQGKYDKAFSSFEAAIGYMKDSSLWFSLTQLEIGNLQRKWGKYEEAKKAYMIILTHSKDEEIKKAARVLLNHMGSQ